MSTIERLLEKAQVAARADGCVLIDVHSVLEAARGVSIQLGDTASAGAFVDRAFSSNLPTLLADDVPTNPLANGVRDALAVPLGAGAGAVVVFHALTAGRFSRDVDAVVQAICRELGAALEMRTEARLEAAERAARLAQERFEAFMNALPAAAWVKDAEGRYVFANAFLRQQFPSFGDTYFGKRDEDLFPAEVSAQFVRSDASARSRSGLSAFLDRTEDGRGAREWHTLKFPLGEAEGQVGGLSFDVTERQRLTRHAEASEEGFLTLAALIPDALLIHRAGHILFVNQAASEMFEVPRADLFGRNLRGFIAPSELAHYDDAVERCVRGEGVRAIRRLITGKGRERTVEFSARSLEFQGAPAVLGLLREFSETEGARSKAEREARLRSMHALSAAVGHHVNNPLTWVMGNLSLLEQLLEGEAKTLAEEAQEGARRIRDLVRSLRLLEGQTGAHLKRASVLKVMTDAVEALPVPGRASVTAHLEAEADVSGDEVMLAQAAAAVLQHAVRSSGMDSEVHLNAELSREYVVLRVVSDGAPLDERQRERLFDPFSVIHLPEGLELSIAWALVRAFGGELSLGPRRERGNELLIRLRRADLR